MAANVSEKEARQVAEDARETEWKLPSFGKELFLGQLPARPDPPAAEARSRGGREGRALPRAPARLPRGERRPAPDRARRADPRRRDPGPQGPRRARHEGRRGVRRPRPLAGLLQPRARARGRARTPRSPRCSRLTSRSASPSRCACSAPRSRSASGCPKVAQGPHLGLPAHRARRRLGPRAPRHERDARPRAATCSTAASCGPRTARSPTSSSSWPRCPKSEGRRGGITAFILPYDTEGVTVEHRNAFMGLRGIENSVTLLEDVFVPKENLIAQGGPGPQDRPHDPQHRPPRAARDLRRASASGPPRSRASSPPSACSGASPSASTTRSRRRSRSSPRTRVRPRGDASTCRAGSPTTRRTTSASRRRSRSSTPPRWAGRSSTS